ncbi:MAG: hypothetical protein LBB89_05875 [Treponema sp.]|nr:hypothetical protein [Treponema sp.]
MRNKKFWLGMLVVALVFGMTVAGCKNDEETKDDSPATAEVSVKVSGRYSSTSKHVDYWVVLTLSDGDAYWKGDFDKTTVNQWVTVAGLPSGTVYNGALNGANKNLSIMYYINGLESKPTALFTATLNTGQLDSMRSHTNVSNSLTAGTTSATLSAWEDF